MSIHTVLGVSTPFLLRAESPSWDHPALCICPSVITVTTRETLHGCQAQCPVQEAGSG